jgi:2-polyprenyl-3-methyl-5-hydroxy-6-metoxy-1,4-benzoquinol methylase/Flp pilus assembly protein TadD
MSRVWGMAWRLAAQPPLGRNGGGRGVPGGVDFAGGPRFGAGMQSDAFVAAVRHHQAGQFAEADRLYRQVLAAEPQHVHALHLSGALAHATGRNEEAVALIGRAIALNAEVPDFHYNLGLALWALDRREDASRHWTRAVRLNPNFAQARLNLGNALREERRFLEAIAQHSALVQLQPQSAAAHNSLGLSLAKAGRDEDAIHHYGRALALQPDFIDATLNLAISHSNRGNTGEALALTMRGIDIRETPENKTLFAGLVFGIAVERDEPELRRFLMRALEQRWSAPNAFAPACIGLIRNGPMRSLIARAAQAWPARLPPVELFGAAGLALNDSLLQALLARTAIADADLEKFLAACRFALLESAEAALSDVALLDVACALARQCFINEYVYASAADEEARARRLRDRVEAALVADDVLPPLWVAAVAAYFPLHELAGAASMLTRPWPAPIAALLVQQIREPQEQAALRASVRQLTPIEGEVSQAVQAQYEANPYPRWIHTGAPRTYASVDAYLRDRFPHAAFRALGNTGGLDILIAGCGTGQQAILTAQQFEGARMLAIDLSRASLAYAAGKTRALGLDIEYAQADIMRLGTLQRRFDLIESGGVLHHLADPYAGWRALLSLLRPGGFMRIGLYSEIARRGVVAARAIVAENGYGSTPAEIRRFRLELMQGGDEPARDILKFNDFYSMSECRDLVFHTQEHRMTVPEIGNFLSQERLQLLGLEIDRTTARQYAARFPADPAMTDLDCWHAFEQENPSTFQGMYVFWVQKPADQA